MDEVLMQKINAAAEEILTMTRNSIFLEMRFLETAVCRMTPVPGGRSIGCDGRKIWYDPEWIVRTFRKSPESVTAAYLHTVLHALFCHPFVSSDVDPISWGLACDIAAEMQLSQLPLRKPLPPLSDEAQKTIREISEKLHLQTAEKIFAHIRRQNLSPPELLRLSALFTRDDHTSWYPPEEEASCDGASSASPAMSGGKGDDTVDESDTLSDHRSPTDISLLTDAQVKLRDVWQDTARSARTELENFVSSRGDVPGSLVKALEAVTRERYDYADFLRKFSVYGEVMHIDTDSFDYSFYCYGLHEYGDVALIEPLEYKEEKRIRDFVIAVDTSGSVDGEIVQGFLRKTWNILSSGSSFFSRVNVHIIQCDSKVQQDTVITSTDELDAMLEELELHGFGGTDFRPVFDYVDTLIEQGKFTDLRGLVYFTDGWGHFPEKQPDYRTAFAFLENDDNNYDVPVWAIKLILPREDFGS